MMIDLDNERAYITECVRGSERWPDDPLPAAKIEQRMALAVLTNGWQAVADEAQKLAHGAIINRSVRNGGLELRRLIDAAEALIPAADAACWAARRAEDSLPPRKARND